MSTLTHIYAPGTIGINPGSGLKGSLSHVSIGWGGRITYFFRPDGLNEKGLPHELQVLTHLVLVETEQVAYLPQEDLELYEKILGTEVAVVRSGYKGKATVICVHPNGCVHVEIQAPNVHPKNSSRPITWDADLLRECEGEAIPKMTKAQKDKSKKTNPSPSPVPFESHPILKQK